MKKLLILMGSICIVVCAVSIVLWLQYPTNLTIFMVTLVSLVGAGACLETAFTK